MNRVIHFEIPASNPSKIAEFYREIFGWDIKKWENPGPEYWMVMTAPEDSKEPGINGGISERKGPEPRGGEAMTSYICTIGVSNLEEYMKKVEDAGGKIVEGKMPIPGMAWLAYCADIEGNVFGLFQEDKNAK